MARSAKISKVNWPSEQKPPHVNQIPEEAQNLINQLYINWVSRNLRGDLFAQDVWALIENLRERNRIERSSEQEDILNVARSNRTHKYIKTLVFQPTAKKILKPMEYLYISKDPKYSFLQFSRDLRPIVMRETLEFQAKRIYATINS